MGPVKPVENPSNFILVATYLEIAAHSVHECQIKATYYMYVGCPKIA